MEEKLKSDIWILISRGQKAYGAIPFFFYSLLSLLQKNEKKLKVPEDLFVAREVSSQLSCTAEAWKEGS